MIGSISDTFFDKYGKLSAITAVNNCLSGTITSAVCHSKSLLLLDFDGAGMNPNCRQNYKLNSWKPFFVDGMFSTLGLCGTIPPCLFQMSNLGSLHLSGDSLSVYH